MGSQEYELVAAEEEVLLMNVNYVFLLASGALIIALCPW